jgi:hypothetical protein
MHRHNALFHDPDQPTLIDWRLNPRLIVSFIRFGNREQIKSRDFRRFIHA